MANGGIIGPMGMQRPFCNCEQQIVLELDGRENNEIDTSSIEETLDDNLSVDVSVETRPGRFDAVREILVITGSSIVRGETLNSSERLVSRELRLQDSGFRIVEWRIEGA